MRKLLASMAVAGMAMGFAPAAGAGDFTTGQVVDFFVKSADLGAARGICIGTADECNQDAKPAGLDMLITFDLDSAELTDNARDNLEVFAKALNDDRLKAAKFVVEGHTDASGTEIYNKTLSERRAASVRAFLVERGVDISKVTAVGLGEAEPRTNNPLDPENRRVEMRISLQ